MSKYHIVGNHMPRLEYSGLKDLKVSAEGQATLHGLKQSAPYGIYLIILKAKFRVILVWRTHIFLHICAF